MIISNKNNTDENGNLSNVILPPDNYVYTFSYNDNGTRYFALGQIDIKIGQSSLDLGTINAEKKYDISGLATLNDISENGIVIFTPVSDLDNETTFEVTKSGGYSGSVVGGNYYVSFQDGLKNEHYSFSEIMNINMPKEYNLTLKDEGFFKGEIISSSELDKIQGSIIQILFESEDGVIHVVETEDADGTFGYGDDYEQIDFLFSKIFV